MRSSSASSAGPSRQSAAVAFARTCAAEVAPAITEATALRLARQEKASSRMVRPRLSANAISALAAVPASAWVLLGGGSVIAVFEATVYDLTGHRQSTMLDNLHVFLALTALQCAPFVAILARRSEWRWRDPVALSIGAAFLVNALLGACWPWWGT